MNSPSIEAPRWDIRQGVNENALSWPVFTLSVLFSIILHLTLTPISSPTSFIYRAFIAAASAAPIFIVIALAVAIAKKLNHSTTSIIFVGYLIGSALRGLTLAWFLRMLGIEGLDWQVRVSASVISLTSTLIIATYAYTTFLYYRNSLSSLKSETRKLEQALQKLTAKNLTNPEVQISKLSAEIIAEMKRIKLVPVKQQIHGIQKLVQQRVRPISAEFASEVAPWQPTLSDSGNEGKLINWKDLTVVAKVPSVWFVVAMGITPIPTAIENFGWATAVKVSVITTLVLVPTTFAGYRLMQKLLPRLKRAMSYIVFTLGLELIAAIGTASTFVALIGTDNPSFYVTAGLIAFPIYGWGFAIGGDFLVKSQAEQETLLTLRKRLNWAIARVNLLAWYDQGTASRLFHGSIQNLLHAAAIRLNTANPQSIIDDLIKQLNVAFEAYSTGEHGAGTKVSSLSEMSELWANIAKVDIQLSEKASQAFEKDRALQTIVHDLCHELCSNAIRHGKAKDIQFNLKVAGSELIVNETDNGTAHQFHSAKGLGSVFLDSCSTEWSRVRASNENRLRVRLPLQRFAD